MAEPKRPPELSAPPSCPPKTPPPPPNSISWKRGKDAVNACGSLLETRMVENGDRRSGSGCTGWKRRSGEGWVSWESDEGNQQASGHSGRIWWKKSKTRRENSGS